MKNFKVLLTLMLTLSLLLLSACGGGNATSGENAGGSSSGNQSSSSAEWPKFISIGTAKSGSSIYAYGTGFANLLSQRIEGIQFDNVESGGTIENLNLIHAREMEMAVGGADAFYDARRGKAPFNEVKDVQLGWKVDKSVPQIVALEESGIKTVEDLKGKRFSIGASGSAANITAITILELHGLSESDVTLSYLGWDAAMEALVDGSIDAAIVLGTLPASAIQQAAILKDIRFVNVDPEKMKENPLFGTTTVPAGTYQGQDEDGILPTVDQFIYFSPDLPEDLVYEITKLGMEETETLGKAHPVGKVAEPITKDQLDFMQGELHPGVVKYYQEKGYLQ
jgi:hypothetical protein